MSVAHASISRGAIELESRYSYTEARDTVILKNLCHAEYIIEPIVVGNPSIRGRTDEVFPDTIARIDERRRMANRSRHCCVISSLYLSEISNKKIGAEI